MIQEQNVNTDTDYSTPASDDSTLIVKIQAASIMPNTLTGVWNKNTNQYHQNNVKVLPGELCMLEKNALKSISYEINDAGELIVNAPDADNYSLDSDGNLIYTYR